MLFVNGDTLLERFSRDETKLSGLYLLPATRESLLRFHTRYDTNRAVLSEKMARGLKFRI